jgi:hypothetical protein
MPSKIVARALCTLMLLLAGLPGVAKAQAVNQSLTFAINAINQIAFVGTPSLTITSATAGVSPTSVIIATATWAVTTNQSGAKITASIPTAMPAGLTLSTSLVAPTGGLSAGYQTLGVTAVDVVTGITKVAEGSLSVSYKLDATAAAGVVTSASRVVTYTITGGT